jgi:hypothetical protein
MCVGPPGGADSTRCVADPRATEPFHQTPVPGRDAPFWLLLSTLTVPAQVTLIPVFSSQNNLNLLVRIRVSSCRALLQISDPGRPGEFNTDDGMPMTGAAVAAIPHTHPSENWR